MIVNANTLRYPITTIGGMGATAPTPAPITPAPAAQPSAFTGALALVTTPSGLVVFAGGLLLGLGLGWLLFSSSRPSHSNPPRRSRGTAKRSSARRALGDGQPIRKRKKKAA